MLSLKNHPPALPYLFLTEMWERFGFYVVQGLLVLYMSHKFGFSDDACYTIQGIFAGLVYFLPMLGGVIADRFLGFKIAVTCGGFLLSFGYGMLALGGISLFYLSLAILIVGNGLFKPNVTSLLGTLYKMDDPHRESGFTIYYVGINIGVLLSGTSGLIKDHFGWEAAFGAACIGLLIGLGTFALGIKKNPSLQNIAPPHTSRMLKLGLVTLGLFSILIIRYLFKSAVLMQWLFPLFGSFLIAFLILLIKQQKAPDRQRLLALTLLIISSVIFWMFFLQIFFSANLFIDRLINRDLFGFTIPTTAFYTLEAIFVILLAPLFAWLWMELNIQNKNPSSFSKFITAIVFVGLSFLTLAISTYFTNENHLINPLWIVLSYLLLTTGEMLLSPIGLSAVTSLSPRHLTGMMMGIWCVGMGFGGYFAGDFAKLSSIPTNITDLSIQLVIYREAYFKFFIIASIVALALLIMYLLMRRKLD